MRLYRVVVHGTGFWNETLQKEVGFFAMRWVKADDADDAAKLTMSAVGEEKKVKTLVPANGNEARISLEEVEVEIDPDPTQIERKGFIFY